MKVTVEVLGPVREPYLRVHSQHGVRMLLRSGSIEVGVRRSAMRRVTYYGGEVGVTAVIWNSGLEAQTYSF